LHLERGRAGERMRQVRMAVLERARPLADGIDDLAARKHRADWLVAAAQSLGNRLDVGRDIFLLPSMRGSGAPHAAHDFVEDEQRAVAVTDLAHGAEIALWRSYASRGGADDRLGNEGCYRVRPEPPEFGFELGRKASHEIFFRLVVAPFV